MTPNDYCELNRKFIPFENNGKDQAVASYESDFSLFSWRSVGWDKLHEQNGPIVILGEPGSGRSYEFKAQRDKLLKSGRMAFYLELHRLVNAEIDSILKGTEDGRSFEAWSRSGGVAYFFLDAVDEAKLSKTLDFQVALVNFRRSLDHRLGEAKIYISSRISAWKPEIDGNLVESELLPRRVSTKAPVRGNAINDYGSNTAESIEKPFKDNIRIGAYVICPLSKDAVRSLCLIGDLVDPNPFLDALDQSYAWAFARRPLGVAFLKRRWQRSGEIGTLTEIVESSACELLKERPEKEDYKRAFPLSIEDARRGAEFMAAASFFCRTLDFHIDEAANPSGRALSPEACLPQDWEHKQCMALIDRPIFDSAIYGTFRFHHRQTAEYLAACWLKGRMERHCPAPVLRDLLFSRIGGRLVLRPSMAPVAVWLACLGGTDLWAVDLRSWLLQSSPEVFLRYGDPSKLPSALKERVLQAFTERYGDREYLNFDTDRYSLSRLVDETTGDSLAALIRDPTLGSGCRVELLKCATESRCSACVSAAFEVLDDKQNRKLLESEAIELIGVAGTSQDLTRLKDHALQDEEFTHTHLGWLVRFLFPHVATVDEIKVWLVGAPNVGRLSTQRYFVKAAFENKPDGWCPFEVLAMLCELNEPSLHIKSTGRDPNYPGVWTKELMFPLLRHALRRIELTEEEAEIVGTACAIISLPSSYREDYNFDEESFELNVLTANHPQVRRVVFWLVLDAEKREDRSPRPGFSGCWTFFDSLKFVPLETDASWLRNDLSNRKSSFDKEAAAWLLFDMWQSNGSAWKEAHHLLKRIKASGLDHSVFRRRMLQIAAHWPPQWYVRLMRKGVFTKWYWTRKTRFIRNFFRSLKELWLLHTRIKKIRDGGYCHWLVNLCRKTDGQMKWAVQDWSKLIKKYGRRITRATQEGCVRVWERFTPEINTEGGTPNGLIAGLSGLQHLYQEGRLYFDRLSSETARKAALYAVNEMNGHADWMEELSKSHPVEVRSVLAECVQAEWERTGGERLWCRHLELLADRETTYGNLILEDVLELFTHRIPGNAEALTGVFKLLIAHGRYPTLLFANRASDALAQLDTESELYRHWLAILIQTDATRGMDQLETEMSSDETDVQSNIMVRLCVMLQGRRDSFPMVQNPDYLNLDKIERFIRLVYRYVNPKDDLPRPVGEAFTPMDRDDAQSFRGALLPKLAESLAPEAEAILTRLAEDPDFSEERDWIRGLMDKCVERRADAAALTPADLRTFVAKNEFSPKNSRDLFDLTLRRLQGIKHDVEDADHSIRNHVRKEDLEVDFRRFVARQLKERNNCLYSSTEESVIREEERLDIRVGNTRCEGHVVIEAKVANLDRSLSSLIEDLESQLCERYLHDQNARYGIFLIGCTADKTWRNPEEGPNMNFDELIVRLKARAAEIQSCSPAIERLKVIGMDFRPR